MKGIVMDIKDNKAVILYDNGEFKTVKNNKYEVGQEVATIVNNYNNIIKYAACFVLCLGLGTAYYGVNAVPVDYVYLDINPSIRLDINVMGKVIDVNPLNEDAKVLLTKHKIDSKETNECINDIVEICKEEKYINETNRDIEIDFTTNNRKLSETIITTSSDLENKEIKVKVEKVAKAKSKEAQNLNISTKRLEVIEEYTNAFGGDIGENSQKLKGTTNKEIKNMIDELNGRKLIEEVKSENKMAEKKTEKSEENILNKDANKEGNNKNADEEKRIEGIIENISDKRLEVITEYTEKYGGSIEYNVRNLRDKTVKQIRDLIDS